MSVDAGIDERGLDLFPDLSADEVPHIDPAAEEHRNQAGEGNE